MTRFDLYTHAHGAVRALVLAVALTGARAHATGGGRHAEPELPPTLAETGLYADFATRTLAPGVLAFEPQYPLWTDGAAKQRWIQLPPGAAIDASDPDHFVFPVGTRLWKEFALERPIETRMLWLAEDGWRFASYAWSADGRSATLAPEQGLRAVAESAPGVPYDIPGRADCCACHDASAERVLGFDALQLSDDRDPLAPHARPLPEGALGLREFVERGLVRGLPKRFVASPPRIAAATPRERAVLGYLSANCGMCHSGPESLAGLGLDLSYSLARGEGAVDTAVERPSRFRWPADREPLRIDVAAPERSVLVRRMASRQPLSQMPPLGTHLRDAEALELVTDWIREDLAARRPTSVSPQLSARKPE